MWVVLLNLGALMEVVSLNDIINAFITAPVNEVREHLLHLGEIKFTGARKPQNIVIIEVKKFKVCHTCSDDPFLEMCGDLVLFRIGVPHEAGVHALFRFT